jgi:NUMOD3 motif
MNFYTYMWLREDGTPYYVGKGRGKRAYRNGCPDCARIVVQEWPDEFTAFEEEKRLIAQYGRKDLGTGILINLTDGGEGPSGSIPSPETRKKMSDIRKGRKLSEKTLQKLREFRQVNPTRNFGENNGMFGKTRPELSAFNTQTKKGRLLSDETRARMSAAHLGKKLPEETKQKMRGPRGPYRSRHVKPI